MSELERRIAGSKCAVDLLTLVPEEHLSDPIYMESLVDRFRKEASKKVFSNSVQPEKPIPIARLGVAKISFGQYADKCFDEIPLAYLDWLCSTSEETAKTIKLYLTHPELESRRRGLGD